MTNLLERAETRRETFYKLTNSADVPDVPSEGGRNYLRGTSDEYQTYTNTNYILGYPSTYRDWTKLLEPLRDKTVTIKAYIKNDTDYPVRMQIWFTRGGIYGNTIAPHSEGWSTKTGKMSADWTSANVALVQDPPTATGGTIQVKEAKVEISETATPYSQAPEDFGWTTDTLVPTQSQRYLWKFEYVYYSNGSVEVNGPANLSIAGADADTTGVTAAIEQTNQTVANLQNSVSQAQSDLATVSSNLTQARQKLENSIASVNTKAQAVETTLAQVQSTANANSQKAATLENSLDGLSAKFSSLKIGAVNLFKNSKSFKGSNIGGSSTILNETYQGCAVRYFKNTNSNSNYQNAAFFIDEVYPELGGEYVLSFWAKGSGTITPHFNGASGYLKCVSAVSSQGTSNSNPDGSMLFNLTDDWQRCWVKYKLASSPADATQISKRVTFLHVSNSTDEEVWLAGVQLEEGNVPTDYSPNEADIEQKVADYKQTADQNYASLQSTVQTLDGTVTANKATADQTAEGFKTRIESLETYKSGESTRANQYFESAKTETARQLTAERTAIANDYVAKSTYTEDVTGLRNDLTATTTTANTTKTNLASYQASNDQAVASLQSSLQTTDGNVSSLQTKISAVPGQITSAVSAVEGKIPTSLGGRNYLRGTSAEYQTLTSDNYILGYTGNKNISFLDLLEPLKGKTVTIRSYIKNDTDFPVRIQVWFTGGGIHGNLVPAHEEGWSVGTGKILESFASCNVAFTQGGDGTKTGGAIQHKNDKLEIGNIPSDWSPAPEDTASQISSLSSQIQQTADGMTLLATKTELNTAKSDLQSGISTATSKAETAQATADSNAQTISTHTAQISALNTGLQAKVSQSDFDSLSGRVTTAESNLTATANQLSSQISSVNERIPTSKDFKNLYVIANSSDGFLAYGSTNLGAANPVYRERTSDYIPVEAGEKYTFQVWATLTENQQGWRAWQFYNEDKSLNGGRTAGNYTSDYQCVQQTLTVPTNAKWMRVSARMYSDGKIMVEKGNEYHDYMLAPEDAISDAALTQAKSEIKQTTDTITASVSSVETKADNAQTTANSAVSKANAAQTAINTLDSEVVKSASLNLDNNGFVTKVGKTIDGNKFATMIAQNANNVKIIADEMQVTADMIVDGAVTAEKLDVNNLSAVNSDLGEIKGGSLLLQENKSAGSATDSWGTYDRPAYKQGLYMDNRAFASSGAIQRKNGGETTPTDMPLAVLQAGELRFLVVDYNDNLKNVVHYGLSDPDFGAIRFEIDSELKRRLTMTSSGYLNFQATNYTNWQSTGVSGCEYMIQGRLVLVNYDVTFSSAGTHTIGSVPQEFVRKSLMLTAKGWSVIPRDKNAQLNPDGSLHILDAEANVNYRGTLVFSY